MTDVSAAEPTIVTREALQDETEAYGKALLEMQRLDVIVKAKKAKFEEDNATDLSALASIKELVALYDSNCRNFAVTIYNAEGGEDKQVAPFIEIELATQPEYDPDALRAAAFTQMPSLLILDTDAVKALALSINDNRGVHDLLENVLPLRAIKVPRASISKKALITQAEMAEAADRL